MSGRRDLLLVIGLFVVLILFVAFGPGRAPQDATPDIPTTYASGPRGAYALFTWIDSMGYDARRLEYRRFELTGSDDALVMLNPSAAVTREEARVVIEWLEDGGTLIIADDTPAFMGPANALLDELQVDIRVYSTTQLIERTAPLQPALDNPPVDEAEVRTGRFVQPRADDYAALLGAPDAPIIVGLQRGRGYAYVSSSAYLFTNEGLRDAGNAALALNLLRRVPTGGRVLFDEYHHGRVEPPASTGLLFSSPWGWAATYAGASIALYLALSGRRFGRAIPLKEEVARRSSAEYVESMADLLLRGGKHAFVQRHYYEQFKRRLGRPNAVSPLLDDAEFVRELERVRPIDAAELRALLARLRAEPRDDAAMLRAIADADAFAARVQAQPREGAR